MSRADSESTGIYDGYQFGLMHAKILYAPLFSPYYCGSRLSPTSAESSLA